MEARRYAVRRLNPYRGVTQVLEIPEARAASSDGVNWEVQVLTERPAGWGSLNLGRVETLYYRYGVWSAAEGLARYPVHPALERARLHRTAERLVTALGDLPADVPALADRFECWLLDGAAERPLALLAAVPAAEAIPARLSSRWQAAPGDADSLAGLGREAAATLERAVARRGAGHAWFERLPDGSGRKVGAGDTAPLPAAAFPELLLDETWADAGVAAAVAAYLDWLAPRLLMLPLAAATRERLERAAATQAGQVARFFPLYPAVCDERLMNALRVEARLVQSAA